jgi:hypothetical protein
MKSFSTPRSGHVLILLDSDLVTGRFAKPWQGGSCGDWMVARIYLWMMVQRAIRLVGADRVFVVCSHGSGDQLRTVLSDLSTDQILTVPEGCGSAVRIVFGCGVIARRNPAAVVTVIPASELRVHDEDLFLADMAVGIDAAQERQSMVLFRRRQSGELPGRHQSTPGSFPPGSGLAAASAGVAGIYVFRLTTLVRYLCKSSTPLADFLVYTMESPEPVARITEKMVSLPAMAFEEVARADCGAPLEMTARFLRNETGFPSSARAGAA